MSSDEKKDNSNHLEWNARRELLTQDDLRTAKSEVMANLKAVKEMRAFARRKFLKDVQDFRGSKGYIGDNQINKVPDELIDKMSWNSLKSYMGIIKDTAKVSLEATKVIWQDLKSEDKRKIQKQARGQLKGFADLYELPTDMDSAN